MDAPIGDRIRSIRLAKGLNQKRLAWAAGLAQSFVSSVERGMKSPTVRSLQKIAGALGVSLQELLGDEMTATPTASQSPDRGALSQTTQGGGHR